MLKINLALDLNIQIYLQISSLVATRGDAAGGAAVQRVGAAVACAVERFVAVGETIADDNPDVRHSMVLACKEARSAGKIFFIF